MPKKITCSQHFSQQTKEWKEVQKINGISEIFVANGSHANYFGDGIFQRPLPVGGLDETSLNGVMLDGGDYKLIMITEKTPWLKFLGRWGEDGGSPSALINRDSWRNPLKFAE